MSKSGPKAPQGDYEVGYGRPPEGTRFKKGRSGNPKGRPPKSQNFAAMMERILSETIKMREGESVRTISKREAIIQSAITKAIKGDARSFISLAQKSGLLDIVEPARTHPVLIVPGMSSMEDWARKAAKHQAKYACNTGEDETEA